MARIIGKGHSFDDVLIVPKYNKIISRKDVSFKTKVTRNYEIDIPIVAANMDTVCESEMAIALGKLGGLGVIHRFLSVEEQVEEIKKVKEEGLIAAAAVGIKEKDKERIDGLVKAGVNILVLDIAHGHSKYAGKTLDYIKQKYPGVDVVAGNIATKDAALYFLSKGADAIKVGVGPGAVCTTRVTTGVGVPQITAIMDAFEETQKEIPICSDGGIRKSGDITKAIGAGANTVMIGNLFAGTEETPGEIIDKDGKKYKTYRGMASHKATIRKKEINKEDTKEILNIEGEETLVEFKGPVKNIIKELLGGLASGMTYVNAKTLNQLAGKADFVEMTSAAQEESRAHGKNIF